MGQGVIMAYLHCHKCHWSQDDFWEWRVKWKHLHKWGYRPFGYNPLSLILEDIAGNIYPRYWDFDQWWADEMEWPSKRRHSWLLLCGNIKRHLKNLFTQKWWTYNGYLKDIKLGKAKCPHCGSAEDLDID
jgi:hypothetical protein